MSRGPHRRLPMPKETVKQVMTVDELPYICLTDKAGRFLRCTPEQVQRKAKTGEIPAYKEGQEWRFRRDDLVAYLEQKITGKEVPA